MESQNNAAKFAFFYMLSLVALVFMGLSAGMIIFQIINKYIIDILNQNQGSFSPEQLKFAISAIIISTPIYYIITKQIHKSLFSGVLSKDSGIRKWLTYFILLVTSVIMIGWLIAVVNNFLDGELTTKIILKAITAIAISATVFSFYLYDIKREEVAEKKDKIIKIYFFASLFVVILVFVASLFIVESPTETRNRKVDQSILENFSQIESAANEYYNTNKKLPDSLDMIREEYRYILEKNIVDPITNEKYEYKVVDEKNFEICANFRTSNKNNQDNRFDYYLDQEWQHDAGYQCLNGKVRNYEGEKPVMIR